MPKRVTRKQRRFEAEVERTPLTPALERRLQKFAIERAPAQLEEWRGASDEDDRFCAVPSAALAAYALG